jgi:hypothetical protein
MEHLVDLLNQNWVGVVIGIVGLILALLGLLAGYIFYRLSKNHPSLAYQSHTYQLLGVTRTPSEEIEIRFRGQKVPQITKSLVSIWNNGNTTIEGAQIANADQLRIVTSQDSEILDATVLRVTRDANRFSLERTTETPNEVRLQFEWLDSGDGALVKLLHTGETRISLAGTLRGVPKGTVNLGRLTSAERKRSKSQKVSRFLNAAAVVITLGGFLSFFIFIGAKGFLEGIRKYGLHPGSGMFEIVLSLLLGLGGPTLMAAALRRVILDWRKAAPETLKLKEDDS